MNTPTVQSEPAPAHGVNAATAAAPAGSAEWRAASRVELWNMFTSVAERGATLLGSGHVMDDSLNGRACTVDCA